MKIKILVTLLAIPLISYGIEIDENIAIELALENNLTLERQRIAEGNAILDNKSSYNVLYPKLQTTTAISTFNSDKVASGTRLMNEMDPTSVVMYEVDISETNLSPGFEASMILTPALINGIKLLNKNAELESLKTVNEEKSVIKNTKNAFYTLLLLEEQIEVYEANYKALQNRYSQIEKNFSAGYVDELTLLEVEVALRTLEPQIEKLKQAYKISIMNFNMILGEPLDTPLTLVGDINSRSRGVETEELSYLVENSGDLKVTKKSIDLLDEQIKLHKNSSFLPVLGLSYSMQTALNDPFNSDSWDKDNFADDMGSFTLFLSMDIGALLPNSSQRVEQKKLENNKRAAELGLKELEKGLNLQLTKHMDNLENSISLQKSLQKALDLAKKKLELTTKAYNQGNKELLEVETAQNEVRKAELELLSEEYNYLVSIFEIEELTGE